MDKVHEKFADARNHMENLLLDTITKLEIGIFDPWLKHLFEEEVKNMVRHRFEEDFPEIPVNFRFSMYMSTETIEYSVQKFYHPFSSHIFLGSIRDHERERAARQKEPFLVDCYYSKIYEAIDEPRVIVRFGHNKKDMIEGGFKAAQEFHSGFNTPLANAYQMAVEAGYIR